MNAETNVRDPQLKFATGMKKGTPLDEAGQDYRIVLHKGEQIALFTNGAMARFYREPDPPEPARYFDGNSQQEFVEVKKEKCGQPAGSLIPRLGMSLACVLEKGHEGDCQPGGNCVKHGEYVGRQCPEWPDCAYMTKDMVVAKLRSPYPRYTISAFRYADGSRPFHPSEPVYCVLEDGDPIGNVDRATVGTGLREYLWLYDKLRELGRSRWAALGEARKIYFL
jgi:hypothetical protein